MSMGWEMLGPAATHPDPNKIRGGRPEITPDDVRLALGGLSKRPFLFGMAAFLGHRGSMDEVEQMLRWDVFDLANLKGWGSGKDRHGNRTGEVTSNDILRIEALCALLLFEVMAAKSRHDTYAHEEALPSGSATVMCPGCRGKGRVSRMASEEERLASQEDVDAVSLELSRQGREWNPRTRAALAAQWHAALKMHHVLLARSLDSDCELCHGKGRFLLSNPKRARMVGVSLRTWERHWNGRYSEVMAIPREWEAIAVGHVRKKLLGD